MTNICLTAQGGYKKKGNKQSRVKGDDTNMTNRPSRTMGCALITGILILLTACGTTGYRSPISKFQDASSVVIASTRIYLTELNKVERDKYINEQVSRKAQIQLIQIEAVQVFSRDGLKARLDA